SESVENSAPSNRTATQPPSPNDSTVKTNPLASLSSAVWRRRPVTVRARLPSLVVVCAPSAVRTSVVVMRSPCVVRLETRGHRAEARDYVPPRFRALLWPRALAVRHEGYRWTVFDSHT